MDLNKLHECSLKAIRDSLLEMRDSILNTIADYQQDISVTESVSEILTLSLDMKIKIQELRLITREIETIEKTMK